MTQDKIASLTRLIAGGNKSELSQKAYFKQSQDAEPAALCGLFPHL